ncbi:hypothetical protein D3C78_1638500 [compost metagenome]
MQAVPARRSGVEAVLAQTGEAGLGDQADDGRADDGPDELGDPVDQHILGAHPPGDEDTQANRRVDVTARHRSDAIGHGDDGETKGQGDA